MTVDDYVVDVLMRDLIGHDHQPTSFLIYLWFTFEAGRVRRERVHASYQTVADAIGISKSAAQSGVRWLIRRKLLEATKTSPTAVPGYKVMRPWRR
jgi:hypothetical protein